MRQTFLLPFLATLMLALLPACAEEEPSGDTIGEGAMTEAPAAQESPADVRMGAMVEMRRQDPYGAFLTDAEGMSLYNFEADTSATSTCYDACAEAWPPLLTDGAPVAGEGTDPALLSTTERRDGTTQVVYGGWPLYYYEDDRQPGDVTGQDIEEYGAEWYLVSPQGETVHAE